MNRRELFKLCGQLTAGLVCAQVARVLPETSPPIMLTRGQREVVIHITAENPYIPKDYAARLEGLTNAARHTGDGIENVTRPLAKFRRKVEQHSTRR